MGSVDVRVVLNPAAGGGRAFGTVGALEKAFASHGLSHAIVLTRHPGHATELLRQAREDGAEVVAVVGGDGTLNEVVQAYVDAEGRPVGGPRLALLPVGTGGDFRRTLGLSGDLEEAVGRLRHGTPRAVDLGILEVTTKAEAPAVMAFVNVASFGIGGDVDALVNAGGKRRRILGGRGAFFLATVRAMARYRNAPVLVSVDGIPWYEGPAFNVAIANGRFFGGGMMIAPHADPGDGRLEVVAIGDVSRAGALALSTKIYRGAHLGTPAVQITGGTLVEAVPARPWGPILVDMDGEQPGCLPLRARLAPGALTFVS